jgi:hypothetical protein
MREVPLTQGYNAIVDDEEYERVAVYNWAVEVRPNTCYASSNLGQGRNAQRVRLHRFILTPPTDMQVDHINRNGLDCRKENMRLTDWTGNGRNIIQPQGEGGTGYRGVYKHHYSERWIARIRDNTGRKLHLGTFESPELAAVAYDEAALRYHGEFAVLNFP